MNNNLITADEFASYRDIAKKPDKKKIDECITQAQTVDLYDVLNEFYFDLIENKDEESYQDLLNGSTFISNGRNYYHSGIKSLLADLTYGRYMYSVNVNMTPFGATQKLSQDSSPVDRNLLKDMAKQTQIDAAIKFQMIDKYLKENKILFPRYSSGDNPNINTHSQRFSVIK
ncbi:hypothetical protein AAU57_08820 [Nonlabens sp. YIK11]|uniref:DUF6712 family protein n=1 Tax=Nonlabens sp. YIK11 TaxID=1453349 RepID=UPI0006DCD21D|nr:hypothetical protein [Nonlabens sp. YIK11]KQC33405.1 hypothetical protein AAU57_08820 [Nonlabens sp. YIK11]